MAVSGQLHVPAALPPGKQPPVLFEWEGWSEHGGEEKKSQPPLGNEPQMSSLQPSHYTD